MQDSGTPRPQLDRLDFFDNLTAENLLDKYFMHFTILPLGISDNDIIYMGRML